MCARLEGHAQFHSGFDHHHAGSLGREPNQAGGKLRKGELTTNIRVLAKEIYDAGLSRDNCILPIPVITALDQSIDGMRFNLIRSVTKRGNDFLRGCCELRYG